ncbi:NUDIX domain-containing protein, partial [[Eubacterium] siraeum]|nr:NUDIX domain-containing protein [[Eubacterium] siraeum]
YGENERETALREVFEECGREAELDEDFRAEYTFHTLDNTEKTSVFFAGRFDKDAAVKIQQEEVIGDWLLSYGKAMNKLNWEQDKAILKACEEYLNSKQN